LWLYYSINVEQQSINIFEQRRHISHQGRRVERERIEQRQATAAPVAPPQERPTNLQKALGLIEECEIQEGKYLEICNLLMDVHRRGVRA